MTKHFLTISFALLSLFASAHQPDISTTMLVEQEDGSWVLQVRASLTAFEYEVHTKYGKDSYKTPEEFNELVIRHVTESISITFGENNAAELDHAFVKLGHETNVVFKAIGIPETITTMSVTNGSFKNIHGNQSALIIIKTGFEKKQFILSDTNEHTAKLSVLGNTFELQANNTVTTNQKN
jgi:hypothetical protein